MGIFSGLFGKKYKNISGVELNQLLKDSKEVLILDVRTSGEFKGGHIPKAKNISVQDLRTKIATIENYKDKPVVVYCASGARSSSAASILAKSGFTNLYNLGSVNNYKGSLK